MTDNRAVSRGLKLLCLGQVTAALILLPFPLLRAAAFAATLLLAVAGLYRTGCRVAIPVVLAALAAGLLPIPSVLSYAAVEVLRLAAFCLVYAAAARRMEAAGAGPVHPLHGAGACRLFLRCSLSRFGDTQSAHDALHGRPPGIHLALSGFPRQGIRGSESLSINHPAKRFGGRDSVKGCPAGRFRSATAAKRRHLARR